MKITVAFLLIISSLGVSAQVNIDSLMAVWNDPNQPDTIRLKAINNIVWDGYLYSKPDSAFYFAQLQYDFAKTKVLKKQMASALNNQGSSFWIKGNYASAIDYYTRSLAIYEEIGDRNGIANSINNIGVIYYEQSSYASAIDYYTRSLAISEEIGDKNRIANSLGNIGLIYKNQGDYVKAIDYHARCLTIKEEIGDKGGIAAALNNIGVTYHEQGNYANAIDYYNRSLIIREEIGDKKGISACLNNIGEIHSEQGNYASAIDYYNRSLTIKKEIGDEKGIAGSLNNIGEIYYEQGDFTSAITSCTDAMTIAQEIGAEINIKSAANILFKAYKTSGRNKQALEMYELYITTRDSIESEENQRAVIRQEYKYEYEKQALADSVAFAKEQKVKDAELEKSRIQQYALYGGLTLSLVFLLFVYNRFRITRRQKMIIADQNEEITSALTSLKVAQSQLIQSEKMASLGQLTAGIAHEINNPLNFIQGNSMALSKDLEDYKLLTAKYREALIEGSITLDEILAFEKKVDLEQLQESLRHEIEGINEGTRRTSLIVKGLTEFSHESMLEMQPSDIHHGIDVTLNLLGSRLKEDIKIIKNYDESIDKINCNISQLNQVFLNLFLNALDAVDGKGQIEVSTKKLDGQVRIAIKDNGIGISKENLNRIFDPFFTTKEVGKGTGLGLSISHGIIENHGGSIEAGEKDKGTEFVITLPADP